MATSTKISEILRAEEIRKKQIAELQIFMKHINPEKAAENCVYCSLAVDTALQYGVKDSDIQPAPTVRFPSSAFYDKETSISAKRKPNQKKKMTIKTILRSYVNHPEFHNRFKIYTPEERVDLTDEDIEVIELDYDNDKEGHQNWIKLLRVEHSNLIEQLHDHAIPVRKGIEKDNTTEFLKEGVAFGFLFFAHKDLSDGHALNWVRFADGNLFFLDAQDPDDDSSFITTTLPKSFTKYYAPHVFYICTTPPEGFKINVKSEPDDEAKKKLELEHKIKQEYVAENMDEEEETGDHASSSSPAYFAEMERVRMEAEQHAQRLEAERLSREEEKREQKRLKAEHRRRKVEQRKQERLEAERLRKEREQRKQEQLEAERLRRIEEFNKEMEVMRKKNLEEERLRREAISLTPKIFQETATGGQIDQFLLLKNATTYYFFCHKNGEYEYIAAKTHGLDPSRVASFNNVVEAFSSQGYIPVAFKAVPHEIGEKFTTEQTDQSLAVYVLNTKNLGWYTGHTSAVSPTISDQDAIHSKGASMTAPAASPLLLKPLTSVEPHSMMQASTAALSIDDVLSDANVTTPPLVFSRLMGENAGYPKSSHFSKEKPLEPSLHTLGSEQSLTSKDAETGVQDMDVDVSTASLNGKRKEYDTDRDQQGREKRSKSFV